MTNPALVVPAAMHALQALEGAIRDVGVATRTLLLVQLRASQLNGCSFCVDLHARELKKAGETDERVAGVAAWRGMPYFDAAERAALDLAEAVTRLGDPADPVPDRVWEEAARHYDRAGISALLLQIASINVWNRLSVATKQGGGPLKNDR